MIYYIGGFKETCKSDASQYLSKLGVKFIDIDWNNSFEKILEKISIDEKNATIIGFSIGSLIALEFAYKNPELMQSLVLCSMSPFYNGYTGNKADAVKELLGNNLFEMLMKLEVERYSEINTPVTFVQGELEDTVTKERIYEIFKHWKNKYTSLIEVPDCGHDIHDSKYLKQIEGIIKTL